VKTVSVIYFSGMGHTAKMAEAVAQGASGVEGVKTNLIAIEGKDIVDGRYTNQGVLDTLTASDAIIFGTPTYMGGPAAQFKAFADATGQYYYNRGWQDKLAAGFSVSGGPAGDKFNTLVSLATLAMQLGMIWVGLGETPMNDKGINRLSFYFGAGGQAGMEPPDVAPNEADKLTGELLGRRVAELAKRF
jgi:NAD(P)H dehydrogenase (quinone)